MKRSEIIEFLNYLEAKYDFENWNYKGIDLWPIVRIQIAYALVKRYETIFDDEKIDSKKLKTTVMHRLYFSVKFRLIFHGGKIFKFFTQYRARRYYTNFLRNCSNTQIVFLGANAHRVQFQNKFYNRFYDPIAQFLAVESFVQIESESNNKNVTYFYKEKVFGLQKLVAGFKFEPNEQIIDAIPAPGLKNGNLNLERYSEQEKIFNKHLNNIQSNAFNVNLMKYVAFWEKTLLKINPKLIFTLCYYQLPYNILYSVAKKMKVKTVEMQHGPQSKAHAAYGRFSTVPENGFNTLPEYFWCWDKNSMKFMDTWHENSFHKTILGGNSWLESWKYKLFENGQTTKHLSNVILYSIQPVLFDDIFPSYLLEAMKQTKEFTWFLRLHPRQKDIVPEIISLLNKHNISNYNIEEATSLPLPLILQNTQINITLFSGTTIEAALMGVKTILIDPRGLEQFPELIENMMAIPCITKDTNELIKGIYNNMRKPKIEEVGKSVPTFKKVIPTLLNHNA